MMFKWFAAAVAALCATAAAAQAGPGDYYQGINATRGDLKAQLTPLLANHTHLSYNAIWTEFAALDPLLSTRCAAPLIPGVYSATCWHTEKNLPTGGECGNYRKEGDCFNREHGWPKSWFGGFSAGQGAQTDLFELWPSDGYVNSLRANLPLGTVASPTYTSSNGCKIGPCTAPGYTSGNCFEPADEFKGDFARSYFYLSTCYAGAWSCCDTAGTNKADIKPWMEKLLRGWHASDPVTDLERQYNDKAFALQGSRLPFVDHPEWVSLIPDF